MVESDARKKSGKTAVAKQLSSYQICLILVASIGINFSPWLHSASQGEITKSAVQTTSSEPHRFEAQLSRYNKQSEPEKDEEAAIEAVAQGIEFIRANDVAAAIQSFERATSLNPSLVAAHYNLGLAFRQDGQLQAAADSFWRAIQADPSFVLGYVNLGAALLEGDNSDQAKDYLLRALELDPELGIAHYNIGLLHQKEGNLAAAFASFRQGLTQSDSAARSHYQIGLLYLSQQQYGDAQKAFENALELDRNYAEAYYNLGVSFVQQNVPVSAITAFDNAIGLQPNFAHAYYAKALVLKELQRYEEAEELLTRASNLYLTQGNSEWATIAQSQITSIEDQQK